MKGWATVAHMIEQRDATPQRRYALDTASVTDLIMPRSTSAADPKGLPAVVGAQRLIASTIDQLPLLVVGGEIPTWLRRPRRYGSMFDQGDLIQWVVGSMLWHGAGYLRCIRVGDSWRLDPVKPGEVQVMHAPGPVAALGFQLGREPIDPVPDSPADAVQGRAYLLHIPYVVDHLHPAGASPLQMARESLEGFADTEHKSWDTVYDGTHSGGRLETDQELAKATAERYRDGWVEARKSRKIPVLGHGLRYVNDVIDPRAAQWVEARAFNQAVVYMMLGIPPAYMGASLVGGQSSLAYSNAQDNNRLFRRNCLEAFTSQIEDGLSRLLPPGRNPAEDQRVAFDYTTWEATMGSNHRRPRR